MELIPRLSAPIQKAIRSFLFALQDFPKTMLIIGIGRMQSVWRSEGEYIITRFSRCAAIRGPSTPLAVPFREAALGIAPPDGFARFPARRADQMGPPPRFARQARPKRRRPREINLGRQSDRTGPS